MNSFAALDSDNEDEVVVQKPSKKEAAKAAPAAVVVPAKSVPAAKPAKEAGKAAGANAPPKAPKGIVTYIDIYLQSTCTKMKCQSLEWKRVFVIQSHSIS
jgi:hypothetical protein